MHACLRTCTQARTQARGHGHARTPADPPADPPGPPAGAHAKKLCCDRMCEQGRGWDYVGGCQGATLALLQY